MVRAVLLAFEMIHAVAALQGHIMRDCVNLTKPLSLAGVRAPPGQQLLHGGGDDGCDAGFCAGATRCYPTTAGIVYYAEFDVPPLPATFDPSSMTDYIYFNIFFGYGNDLDNPAYPACLATDSCSGDGHGRFNQFVPQLMLGSALCNSSNAAVDPASNKTYSPYWCTFDRWHIGAQYFFALYPDPTNHSSASGFDARAATGELIAVEPGETVYTRFTRGDHRADGGGGGGGGWKLATGVVGDRVPPSVVHAPQPFMGLVPSAPSWAVADYDVAYAGSCWELYGNRRASDYPPFMHYRHTLTAPTPETFWHAWALDEGSAATNCSTTVFSKYTCMACR